MWITQGVGNEKAFVSEFKQRLIDSYKQNWHASIAGNDKYRWYNSFKDALYPDKYLDVLTNKWHRGTLVRFRTRTLGLYSNKRWFISDPLIHSVCPVCSDGLEDELHFLFDCNAYNALRITNTLFIKFDMHKHNLGRSLSSGNNEIIKSLGAFIALANNLRKKKLQRAQVVPRS